MATLQSTLKLTLLDQVSARAKHISSALNGLQRQTTMMSGTMRNLLAFGATYLGVTEGLQHTVGAALSFESAFADVRKVVDASDEQLKGFERTIRKLSTQIPATANDLAKLYASGAESGIATDELNKFAEMASRVGIAFDIPMEQAGESLAKLKTQLGLTLTETGDLADAMNHLSNSMASKASDIQAFMLRVGALAEMGGLAKEEIAAMGSAMIAAGAEPEVAATAMQNVVKAMTRGTSAKKAQKDVAKALGLNLPQLAKDMQRDAPKAIKKVLAAIAKQPKDKHISLLSDFFGDEAKAFAPLVGNIKLLDDALAAVGDKTKYAGSAFKEYIARANTTGNVLQILQNKFAELGRSIGDDMLPGIKEAALGIGDILDSLGSRAHIFDDLKYATKGFLNGLGMEGGIKEAIKSVGDLLLGPADGSASADELGRIFAKFQEYGRQVKQFAADVKASIAELEQSFNLQPGTIVQTLEKVGSMGFKLALAGVGIGILAGTIRTLAGAMYFLSGASTAVGILKTLASLSTTLTGTAAAASMTSTATSTGTAFGAAFATAAGAAIAAGLLVALKNLDPTGDLWGSTSKFDDWIKEKTGWSPSKDGLSIEQVTDTTLPFKKSAKDLWGLLLPGADPTKRPYRGGREMGKSDPGGYDMAGRYAYANSPAGIAEAIVAAASVIPRMTGTSEHPGKMRDDHNLGAVANVKTVSIDAASISAMLQPAGVQQVHVVNQAVPNVTVSAPITVNGVSDPQAAASSAASQLGAKVKSAVESTNTD